MKTTFATTYGLIAALVATLAFGCSGMPAASAPPDSSKVLENPVIPPEPAVAPGPLAIVSERSSSSSPLEPVVPSMLKSSESDTPHQRFLSNKQFMLGLINEERKKAGVPEVSLGDNNAAQIHAENSIGDCVSGHWGTDGLGPPMRYSLAGGYQSNRENVAGLDYCLTEEERPTYSPIQSIQSELRDHMDGYIGSPGHKENILDPWHRKVNLGLVWDTHQMWTVQHFEGDYADCSVPPTIEETTLQVSCTVSEVFPSNAFAQQIFYDPPPQALTRGQLARSYGYRSGNKVALLRGPARPGYRWTSDEEQVTHYSGCTPYDVDSTLPPPSSPEEAWTLFNAAKRC
ncbi:MAG: CAP domain-containing protein, partial [Chloroflexota bacterium]|nr:CAP domain-containing protein [Chloroflexota bacterium]